MTDQSSKFAALGTFLANFEGNELKLSLADIANLVGSLPDEATRNQFWANIADRHDVWRRQWLDNRFHAYFDRSEPGVRFVRDTNYLLDEDRSDKLWSDAELRTCVVAYRRLWEAEQLGEKLNKSELRREALAGGLFGRVKGSYEFRMQNISALLDELGLPFVRGYLPRKNLGSLKTRLVSIINDVWQREGIAEVPTADPEALETRVVAALDKLKVKLLSQPPGTTDVKRLLSSSSRFIREPDVIAWVVLRADGRCEACGEVAPFCRADGTPFLEVHHLRPLAEGGPDVVTNALATCPNCHRRLHHGADRQKFRRLILRRMPGLVDFPKRAAELEG